MILTEEQRGALAHAINYIDETDLPVGELDGFDREVLRAMIDSSDPIPDVTELVELLAAGEHEQWAVWAQAILDSEPGLSDGRKAAWPEMIATPYENLSEELKNKDRREVYLRSQAALDYIQQQSTEIDRLRASLIDLHAEYINTLEKNPECSAWDLDEQSDADQKRLRRNAAHAISIVEPPIYLQAEQRATKIKELEDALVEERARCIELGRAASTGRFKPVPPLQESKELARRQLQRDGKIGPDAIAAAHNKCSEMVCYNCGKKMEDIPGEKIKGDYLIGEIWLDPGQEESRWDPPIEASYYFECHECAPSWEITEERKAAIKELSELLTAIGCPSCHYYIQKNYGEDITVLRAMLTEADHDKP